MSQQKKFESSISQTLTVMTKTVKLLHSEACAFKKTVPRHIEKRHRAALCGRRIRPFRHLQHLSTIGQQSEHQKKPGSGRQEAPKDAEEEDREKNGYITA